MVLKTEFFTFITVDGNWCDRETAESLGKLVGQHTILMCNRHRAGCPFIVYGMSEKKCRLTNGKEDCTQQT